MIYEMPWRRTYAEWDRDELGWYPTTTDMERWLPYLRRVFKRVWWAVRDFSPMLILFVAFWLFAAFVLVTALIARMP